MRSHKYKPNHCLNQYTYTHHHIHENQVVIDTNGTPKIRIDLCFLEVVRVWVDPLGVFSKKSSYAVVSEEWNPIAYMLSDEGHYLRILTQALSVRIYKSPLRIAFYQSDDTTLISSESENNGIGWSNDGSVGLSHAMGASEHFYGLGEDNDAYQGNMDRRGTSRDMVTGQTITKGCVTADIPITFFMSTGQDAGGYGMFVDNTYHMEFNMGKESEDYYYWKAQGGELLYYFMYGPSLQQILDHYTRLTGRPSMPPLWALGFIQSKCAYRSWEEIDDVIATLRKKSIPMDVMVFDYDWAAHMMDFQWHAKWEGKSPEKLKAHKSNGVKFLVSNSGPMIKKDSPNYENGVEKGIFATDSKGNTLTCGHYGGELMDFTSPNMKSWIWSQLQPRFEEGVDGWWLDLTEPEGDPIQTLYQGGSRDEIHNVFSLLNSKTYYEMQKAYAPNTRPYVLTRTGTAGIQRYGTAIWTGDVFSDYETFSAHCPEALNSVMSGIAYWTCDSGGFISSTYDSSSNTHIHLYKNDMTAQGLLYERWMQFSCFSPVTRAHHVGPETPYIFGSKIEESCKHYLQLRYQLMPYIYSYAWETNKTGAPLMRPLVFEYQADPHTYNLKDEYLFGREMLVAPVLTENTSARSVYFPEGTWIDYDYGCQYEGGKTYTVFAPQNRIPVFVKSGAIIPMAPLMQYTDEKPWDPMTFDIYPEGESSFTVYRDDGKTMAFADRKEYTETSIKCIELSETNITVDVIESNKLFVPTKYAFILHLTATPTYVEVNGRSLPACHSFTHFEECEEGWYWDKYNLKLYAKYNTTSQKAYMMSIRVDSKKLLRPAPIEVSLTVAIATNEKTTQTDAQIPYFLPPATIPCKVQAENYDRGGEGVAYHTKLPFNAGQQYRNDNVNIELTSDEGGGYDVFDLDEEEWLEYTLHVVKTAVYDIHIRLASLSGGALHIEFDHQDVTKTIHVESTHGKQQWTTVTVKGVSLDKGEPVMKVRIDKGLFNLNYVEIAYTKG